MEHVQLDSAEQAEAPKLSAYAPTPYVDESWTVINAQPEAAGFAPLQVQSVSGVLVSVDPMFEDFTVSARLCEEPGGISTEASAGMARESRIEQSLEGASTVRVSKDSEVDQTGVLDEIEQVSSGISLQEHEQLLQAAISEATAAAQQSAQAEADARVQALSMQLAAVKEDLKAQVSESLAVTEQKAADLALSIARKLVGAVAESSVDYLKPLIKEAITAAGNAEIKRIRVSPRDYEALKSSSPEAVGVPAGAIWGFEPDESVRVGCIVVTSAGEADFDLDRAWERLKRQILNPAGAEDE